MSLPKSLQLRKEIIKENVSNRTAKTNVTLLTKANPWPTPYLGVRNSAQRC